MFAIVIYFENVNILPAHLGLEVCLSTYSFWTTFEHVWGLDQWKSITLPTEESHYWYSLTLLIQTKQFCVVIYTFSLLEIYNNNSSSGLVTLSPWRTLQNVIQTQKCEPCQLNNTNFFARPFPAGGFPSDTASSTRPKAQAWPQFKRHALDNNGWV